MEKQTYKVGDVVLMGPYDWQHAQISQLAIFPDLIVEIEERIVIKYKVKRFDYGGTVRTALCFDEQILGYAFNYHQIIEVSNGDGRWFKRKFIAYVPHHMDHHNNRGVYVVVEADPGLNPIIFHQCRPLPKAKEPIDISIDILDVDGNIEPYALVVTLSGFKKSLAALEAKKGEHDSI